MEEIASRKDATPSQIALGWLHAQGEDVFPVSCGARNLFFEFLRLLDASQQQRRQSELSCEHAAACPP